MALAFHEHLSSLTHACDWRDERQTPKPTLGVTSSPRKAGIRVRNKSSTEHDTRQVFSHFAMGGSRRARNRRCAGAQRAGHRSRQGRIHREALGDPKLYPIGHLGPLLSFVIARRGDHTTRLLHRNGCFNSRSGSGTNPQFAYAVYRITGITKF